MSELRLTGGTFRGRRLRVPPGVRPTEGRLRESLFSIWQDELSRACFLDLFAGAGAVGLEALGRGARGAVLVEGDPRVARTLKENVESLDTEGMARVYRLRLPAGLAVLSEREPRFDLAFVDPPYGFDDAARVLAALPSLMVPGGAVCFEHASRDAPPLIDEAVEEGLALEETRRYGDSCLSFYRAREALHKCEGSR